MSQNRFYATALAAEAQPAIALDSPAPGQRLPVEVLTGWDRPLKYFFLNVTTYVPHFPELEQTVYDNLRYGNGSMTIQQVIDTLTRLGITYPEGLAQALESQQQANLSHDQPEWPSVTPSVEPVAAKTATVEAWRIPRDLKWSGRGPVPTIGQKVTIHMNSFGSGPVRGYYHDAGWLGVLVDVDKLPKWYCQGQHPKPLPNAFGRELEPYLQQ